VYCYIAFFQIENGYFHNLLIFLFPSLKDLLPKASQTIRKWVIEKFEEKREEL